MTVELKNKILSFFTLLFKALVPLSFAVIIYDFGFPNSDLTEKILDNLYPLLALGFFLYFLFQFLFSSKKINFLHERTSELTFNILMIIVFALDLYILFVLNDSTAQNSVLIKLVRSLELYTIGFIIINAFIGFTKMREKWFYFSFKPSTIFVLSFLTVIFAGALLLKMPEITTSKISWIDSLFVSTSAVCVTGLSTINIAQAFTLKGQLIIMGLIQVGGLGMITFTTFLALFIRKGFHLRDQAIMQDVFSDENLNFIRYILRLIVLITVSAEFIGACALYVFWDGLGLSPLDHIFKAVFHSVSAYCNAGLSTFVQGYQEPYISQNIPTLITTMLLIISGGIGFYTISDIIKIRNRENFFIRDRGLRLQTRIILYTTGILIVSGALMVFLIQHHSWEELPLKYRIVYSFFTSVTSRTAGFSCVEIGNLLIPTCFVLIILMYIGAAPNSTGGGIKVTTFVTLFTTLFAFARGKERVEIGWNTIPMLLVRRAFIVFIASVSLIITSVFILTITEDADFFEILFESVSAFGTVGLSRGLAPHLSDIGRLVIICVMFLGRIGMYTIAITIVDESEKLSYRYPETSIMIG